MRRPTERPTGATSGESAEGPAGWVDRHGEALYRYALLRLRSPELAADAVQETFLDALRARETFAGRSSERTWLVGILRHKILDHVRRAVRDRERRRAPGLVAGAADGSAPEPEFDRRGHWRASPADWRADPGRQLESREFWDAFAACLAKLPPVLADAFFLRELDGLDADHVRSVLDITAANLWTRLHRARSLLRRCLESGGFESPPGP